MFYSFDFSKIIDFFTLTTIKLNDVLEIALIIIIIYQLLKHLKDTRAWIIAKGVLILFILYGLAYFASFNIIIYIASALVAFLAMALVIMFQPELRKFLENLGKKSISADKIFKLFKRTEKTEDLYTTKSIEELIKSVTIMSKAKTGALILIERDISLSDYETSGIKINADISNQLIINIFEKNTPLHDGAMIIRNNKIAAATCYLPLTDNRKIDKSLGTRHRAAIGASEETDALIIVVSEETGAISIVIDGKIKHGITVDRLHQILKDNQIKGIYKEEPKEKIPYKRTKITILSIIFGLFLWIFLTDTSDPIVAVKFHNIPVEVINTDEIIDTGYVYEIIDGKTIDITVKGHKSEVNELNEKNFTAIADASYISLTNSINITVSSNKYAENIEIDTNNKMTTIALEEAISINCPITTIKMKKEEDGYFVTKLEPTLKTITITGPKSKLNTLEKAVANIDVSNKTSDFEIESELVLYDKNGSKMDLSDCQLSTNTVTVIGTVNKTKEVPIIINAIDSSIENCNIQIDDIELSHKNIIISANDEILENLNEIEIQIDTASNSTNKINSIIELNDYMPEEVYLADDIKELTVSMKISRIITEIIEFNSNDIKYDTKNEVTFKEDTFQIEISYLYENKDMANISKLKPYIDISSLEKGKNKVEIKFENIPQITINNKIETSIVIE